jgi:hypothetical protein
MVNVELPGLREEENPRALLELNEIPLNPKKLGPKL